MKTTININRHVIAANKKKIDAGITELDPPISASTYKSNDYGNRIEVLDDRGGVILTVWYTPEKPLPCGATAYITTYNEVRVSNA